MNVLVAGVVLAKLSAASTFRRLLELVRTLV